MKRATQPAARAAARVGLPAPQVAVDAYVAGAEGARPVTLAYGHGHWLVLFFYGGDFDVVGATDVRAFADVEAEFRAEHGLLLAASTDSYLCHRAWLESHPLLYEIAFPVLADSAHRLARAYGVLDRDGSARRATFLIDPRRIVRAATMRDGNAADDAAAALRTLRTLRAAAPAAACY